MSVINLPARAAEPTPEPEPSGYLILQPAARHSTAAFQGRAALISRAFGGNFCSAKAAADLPGLIEAAIAELQRLRRFIR